MALSENRDGEFLVSLETPRAFVVLPPPSWAPAALDYFVRNRAHLDPWEPAKDPEFYTLSFWTDRLARNQREFAAGRAMRLLVTPKGTVPRRVIGAANFTEFVRGSFQACLLGYSVDHEHEGKGVMFEALQAAIDYAFLQLSLHRVMANYQPHNERSGRLLSRLGFEREGYARDYLFIGGSWRDHVLTSKINPYWNPR